MEFYIKKRKEIVLFSKGKKIEKFANMCKGGLTITKIKKHYLYLILLFEFI